MKLTENMLRMAFAERDAKLEKTAERCVSKLLRFVQDGFQDDTDFGIWYRASYKGISRYLAGEYADRNDMIADSEQKKACLNAAEYLYFRTIVYPVEIRQGTSRYLRTVAATCILAMYVPGRHLGFTVTGSSVDRYLLTAFGGTLDQCGKYGFGTRIFEKAPEKIKPFLAEITEGGFRD